MPRTLPHPASKDTPKYWQNETGGRLRLAVKRYLSGETLTVRDLALMHAYLRQWVESPAWDANPFHDRADRFALGLLRAAAREASSKAEIERCINFAVELGMDPL
jgi:hypothetical protein